MPRTLCWEASGYTGNKTEKKPTVYGLTQHGTTCPNRAQRFRKPHMRSNTLGNLPAAASPLLMSSTRSVVVQLGSRLPG